MSRLLVFRKESRIDCRAEELFRWHEHPDAFRRLMPPGEPVKIIRHDGSVRDGAKAILKVGYWPVAFKWELEHRDYRIGEQFCDIQIRGPFKSYRHEHRMMNDGPTGCVLSDTIYFEMPGGWLGRLMGKIFMMPKFRRLFDFRHEVTRRAFV